MSFLEILEYSSVFIFALTGALVASRAQLDPVGFLFIAALTAVGGGTVRDLLLDRNPLFWIDKPIVLVIAAVAAMITFFTAHLLESRLKTLTWLDAAALAVAVPAGVGVAVNQSQEWPIVLIMGVTTGCFGGLMRDVVCNEVPLVLKQGELYISAAFIGAGAAMIAIGAGIAQPIALIFCAGVTFALRAGSLALGWSMPAYKSRPPRQ
jgi:uncharacterized membrane protein YeiH